MIISFSMYIFCCDSKLAFEMKITGWKNYNKGKSAANYLKNILGLGLYLLNLVIVCK